MTPDNARRLSTLADRATACRENLNTFAALPYVRDLLDYYEAEIALPDSTTTGKLFAEARRLHFLADHWPRTETEANPRSPRYDKRPRASWSVDPGELRVFLRESATWDGCAVWRRDVAGPVFARAAAPETVEAVAQGLSTENQGVLGVPKNILALARRRWGKDPDPKQVKPLREYLEGVGTRKQQLEAFRAMKRTVSKTEVARVVGCDRAQFSR